MLCWRGLTFSVGRNDRLVLFLLRSIFCFVWESKLIQNPGKGDRSDLFCMCMLMNMVKCIWVCVAGSQDSLTGISCLLPCEFQGSNSNIKVLVASTFFLGGGEIENHFISNLNKMILSLLHFFNSCYFVYHKKRTCFLYYICVFIDSLILCLELFNVKRLYKNSLLYVRTNTFTKSRD